VARVGAKVPRRPAAPRPTISAVYFYFDESGDYAFPADRFDCYVQAALITPDSVLPSIATFVEQRQADWDVHELWRAIPRARLGRHGRGSRASGSAAGRPRPRSARRARPRGRPLGPRWPTATRRPRPTGTTITASMRLRRKPIALSLVHPRPGLERVAVDVRPLALEQRRQPFPRHLDGLAALPGAVRILPRRESGGGDAFQVGGELPLRLPDCLPSGPERSVAARGPGPKVGELGERDRGDVIVEGAEGNRGRSGAVAGRVVVGATVDAPRPAPATRHDVPARRAADEAGEQRHRLGRAEWSRCPRALRRKPGVLADQRRVGGGVHVPAEAQLAEVDAVAQQSSDACGRHREVVRDREDRLAGAAAGEGPADLVGALVGHESPRVGVTPVAAWRLAMLPDAGGGGPFAEIRETLGVLLELALGVGEQDRAHIAAARGRGVDALTNDDDPAAGFLRTRPSCLARPSRLSAPAPRSRIGAERSRYRPVSNAIWTTAR
jgi:hypothetical protein